MKRLRWLIFIPVLILVFAALRIRHFIKSDLDSYVNVLSSTNEAFIFIGRSTTGESGSGVGILLKTLLTIYPHTVDERDDLIVIHIKEGQISKSDLRNFGYSGSAFPFHGVIYFMRGGQQAEWPLLWKWNGTGFTKVEKTAALQIANSFSFTDAIIKAEGWKEARARFDRGETAIAFPLESGQCIVTLNQEVKNEEIIKTVRVRGEGYSIHEETLTRVEAKSRKVSKSEYFQELKAF